MGKSTISMAIFNSYVSLPEGTRVCSMWRKVLNAWNILDPPRGLHSEPGLCSPIHSAVGGGVGHIWTLDLGEPQQQYA